MLSQVLNHISQYESFVLTSHARPDGDAIGSSLACCQILRAMGKRADVVLADGVPHLYRGLPLADSVLQASAIDGSYQAAIILECDSLQRSHLGGLERHFLINIDHHASGKAFAHVNWIDPNACATAELIYRLGCGAGVCITPSIATCLYIAVLTDTGSFCFSGTNEHTFILAQELVRAGADPVQIAQSVYFANPASKMRLLGCALCNLQREDSLAWMYATNDDMRACGASDQDCEGLVNYALGIAGVEVAAFFRGLDDGRFRVSLRSKGATNVAKIAESFHGGGHECASGFSLSGPLDSATRTVLTCVRQAMKQCTPSLISQSQ